MTYGKFCDMLPVFAKRVCVSYFFLYITKHVLTFRHKICDSFFFFWYIWKNVHLPFFLKLPFLLLLYLLLYIFFCLSNSAVVE